MVNYFYSEDVMPTPKIIKNGINWLINNIDNEIAVLHVPVLSNLSGNIEKALSVQVVSRLKENKEVEIDGINVHLSLDARPVSNQNRIKLLYLFARSTNLNRVETRLTNISQILAVPGITGDILDWKKSRGAIKHDW